MPDGVAVNKRNLSNYLEKTLLVSMYTHHGNLILSSLTATQQKGVWELQALCR